MVKRSIGIDIGRHHIRAVQIARTAGGLQVEKSFGLQTRRSTDSPAQALRSLTSEHGFDRRAEVVVSLPHHGVFFADTQIDTTALGKLRAGETALVKDSFPLEAADTLVQICSVRPPAGGKCSILAAATSRQLVERELRLLEEAKIRPTAIDTPIGAVQLAVATNHPEVLKGTALILCADEQTASLAVTQDGSLLLVRTIPTTTHRESNPDASTRQLVDLLRSEIQITWRRLFGTETDAKLQVFLVAAPRVASSLAAAIEEETDYRVTALDAYARLGKEDEGQAGFCIAVAEGLALRVFAADRGERPDFLAAYRSRVRPAVNARRELAVCAVLCASIVLVWTFGLFLRLSRLESQRADVETQIEQIFRRTLPDEKNIVDPAAQLKQKLDAIRAEYTMSDLGGPAGASPLDILHALATHPPAQSDLMLDDMLIMGDSVRLTGSCKSFVAFSEWQHSLEEIPGFKIVEVPNPRKDASTGKVHFSLSLSCGKVVQ
jgi:hypothetical protein